MTEDDIRRQLTEFIDYPRESLDVEVKQWIDPTSDDSKAVLAKELLALANHGGGTLIIGFKEIQKQLVEDENRPTSLEHWNQDYVQGIVTRYAEPSFEVRVRHVASTKSGQMFPVISVAGGHKSPILAKRSSPDEKKVVIHRIYIRRPGPCSEEPKTSEDWSNLLSRCLGNRQDELLAVIRGVLGGYAAPNVTASLEEQLSKRQNNFVNRSRDLWDEAITSLPPDSSARFPLGHYEGIFQLQQVEEPRNLAETLRVIEQSVTRNSGWPAFVVLQRDPFRPKNVEGSIQSWFQPEANRNYFSGPAYNDFWRVDPAGLLYLRRGYTEDGTDRVPPGTAFDITVPIWRVADAVYQARNILVGLFGDSGTMSATLHFSGLQGRNLMSVDNTRMLSRMRVAVSNSISSSRAIELNSLPTQLPEVVYDLLRPIYELFDFFELPKSIVDVEVDKYLKNRF